MFNFLVKFFVVFFIILWFFSNPKLHEINVPRPNKTEIFHFQGDDGEIYELDLVIVNSLQKDNSWGVELDIELFDSRSNESVERITVNSDFSNDHVTRGGDLELTLYEIELPKESTYTIFLHHGIYDYPSRGYFKMRLKPQNSSDGVVDFLASLPSWLWWVIALAFVILLSLPGLEFKKEMARRKFFS